MRVSSHCQRGIAAQDLLKLLTNGSVLLELLLVLPLPFGNGRLFSCHVLVNLHHLLQLSDSTPGLFSLLLPTFEYLQMLEGVHLGDFIAELSHGAQITFLVCAQQVDEVRDDLPLVGVPVQRSDEGAVRNAALEKAPQFGFLPVDAAEGLFQRDDRSWGDTLDHR